MGLGVGPGDEVITVPNTFIATVEAISLSGATPVFVDVDHDTLTMDPSLIEAAITSRTKAIMPVHLYGQCADMDPILAIARRHGLYVIEDAAQAQGSEYKGRRAGSMGDAAGFSFYPGKNLGAYGEAGAVTTGNAQLAAAMKMFRDHGQSKKYHHDIIGWNARMDGFQGAILCVKLKHLAAWNEARRRHARQYQEMLADVEGIGLPTEADYARHIYHVYAARVEKRDAFMGALAEKRIGCGIHYPINVHRQKAYAKLGLGCGRYPISERSAAQEVSLPMFPELTSDQVEYVCQEIRRYCRAPSYA